MIRVTIERGAEFFSEELRPFQGREVPTRVDLIEETSCRYAEAFAHDTAEVTDLVNLYTLVSRMQVLSSPQIIASADRVICVIIETYLAPHKTFHDIKDILDNEAMNPLREFSNACREELQWRGAS